MIKSRSSNSFLKEQIDQLLSLCSHIAQMADHIRMEHLEKIPLTSTNVYSTTETLLSMAGHIEGSLILLESLLAIEQRRLNQSRRISYTREELFQLRNNVTQNLSDEIGILLEEVVDRESNDAVDLQRQSWRDIRTILM